MNYVRIKNQTGRGKGEYGLELHWRMHSGVIMITLLVKGIRRRPSGKGKEKEKNGGGVGVGG